MLSWTDKRTIILLQCNFVNVIFSQHSHYILVKEEKYAQFAAYKNAQNRFAERKTKGQCRTDESLRKILSFTNTRTAAGTALRWIEARLEYVGFREIPKAIVSNVQTDGMSRSAGKFKCKSVPHRGHCWMGMRRSWDLGFCPSDGFSSFFWGRGGTSFPTEGITPQNNWHLWRFFFWKNILKTK